MSAASLSRETLRALPKVDLHRHLEGALRPRTLWELHCREKQNCHASLEALQNAYTISAGERPGFEAFLGRFNALHFKYGGEDALERMAAEAVADAAADGVIHLELRFSPVGFARRMQERLLGVPAPFKSAAEVAGAVEALARGARGEARRQGISVAFIATIGRHFGAAANQPTAELPGHRVGAEFSALDLAGEERYAAAEFAPVFARWKEAGRGVTIHAGEDPNGLGAASVREALDFGADRIGHGIRAHGDPRTVERLARSGVALEVCLTSNFQTRACATLRVHPLRGLLEAGVCATLNTDDPAVSMTTLSGEYALAQEQCGLTPGQLRQCALNAAQAAYVPAAEKARLLRRISEAWDAALGAP